jgi:hypothetical protein
MYSIEIMARKAEQRSDWAEATRLWKIAGRKEDADACLLLFNSIDEGDRYRQRVLTECGNEPSKENAHAWVRWYDGMTKVYNQMFRK